MKLTSIETSNFLGARDVSVKLSKPVVMFAGKNFSGKSSVQEAVRMALTGESVRVELKKDYEQLITEGQDAGFVTVQWDGGEASVVLPSGKRNLSGDEHLSGTLPYVLDAQRFARLADNDRRSFLFGLMGVKLDGATVKERLTVRKCYEKKIELVIPMLRAGFDAGQKEAAAKAREAKASWKTLTGGETWGKDKAAKWAPAPLPENADTAASSMEVLQQKRVSVDANLSAAQQELGAAKAELKRKQDAETKRGELQEHAGKIDRIRKKLDIDSADLADWEKKVADCKALSGGAKVNPQDPGEYLLRGLASVTAEFLELTCNHPDFDWDSSLLNRAAAHLSEFRSLHGEPVCEYVSPQPDSEALAKLPEYENAVALLQRAVANGKRDLDAAKKAAEDLKALDEIKVTADVDVLQGKVTELTAERDALQAEIQALREIADKASRRKALIEQVAKLHQDVLDWSDIADALAPDGIPGEMLAEALAPINDRLLTNSKDAEWGQVVIHSDMRITVGLRSYSLLSESEKWRADAMIAEAVSHLAGMKLLVLDRFDVLDMKGREDMLIWLDILAQDGEIETALIFGTLKSLPAQLPDTVDAFWLENGVTGKLEKAAA